MYISPINAYGYQSYMPRTQGLVTKPQNLPQKKGNTEKVLLWSGLAIVLAAVAALLLKGKGIKNFKKTTSFKVSAEPPKPAKATEIPLKDTNLPKVSKLSPQEAERNIENACKTIIDAETELLYSYDKNGYVFWCADDVKDEAIRRISRNADGSVAGYTDFVRDTNGMLKDKIHYNVDGTVIK